MFLKHNNFFQLHLFQRAMTTNELSALDSQASYSGSRMHGGLGYGSLFAGKRINSAWALAGGALDNPEDAMWLRRTQSTMRKVKSAENLCNPRIIVNR